MKHPSDLKPELNTEFKLGGSVFRVACKVHGIEGLACISGQKGGITVIWDHHPDFEYHYPRDLMTKYFTHPGFWSTDADVGLIVAGIGIFGWYWRGHL